MTTFPKTETTKSIDDYLNAVDYSSTKYTNYVPSEFAVRFSNFIKLVNGSEGEENTTPIMHLMMLDRLTQDDKLLVNLCFRGAAKTTLLGEYLVLYLAIFQRLPYIGLCDVILFVGDTIENGAKNFRQNVESRYMRSEFLQTYVPYCKFTDKQIRFTNIEGKSTDIKLYGALTGIRGTKGKGKRPKLAILDDLLSNESAKSPTAVESIKKTIYNDVIPALHPTSRKIIFSGTPFNKSDPIIEAVESGAWATNVYPICEKFPCSREEFKGAWGERFSYDAVFELYETFRKTNRLAAFYQEYMLRITNQENRSVQDEDIKWYYRRDILKNKQNYNFYITSDFATTDNTKSDFNVLSVWAYDFKGDWFWVDGCRKQQTIDKTFDDIFNFVQIYKPVSVGIEVSGQQQGFVSLLLKDMVTRDCFFNIASYKNGGKAGIKPDSSKFLRFSLVVPLFKHGKINFPYELKSATIMQEAVSEISLVTQDGIKSKHDDILDTISQLPYLNAYPPSNRQEEETQEEFNNVRSMWETHKSYSDSTQSSSLDSYLV